jgi:enoyl-CoA hydratase/carnithine racemase
MAQLARQTNALFARWYSLARPLVTAVNGHAVAGGMVLALCGDVRVGPTSGRFGLTEVRAGIPFPSAAMAVVRGELGPSALRRMVLRAELFDAANALALGCFDEITSDDAVLTRALEVADELASLPPRSFEAAKARVRAGAFDRDRGRFGGASMARDATAESRDAARRLLDDR